MATGPEALDAAPRCGEAPPTGGVGLAAWRELDWRFALPLGALRSVVFVGRASAGEVAALRALGATVAVVAEEAMATGAAARGQADVVVLEASAPGAVPAATGCVRPGGWVLVRTSGTVRPWCRGTGCTAAAWTRRLRRAGLVDVASFWHAPGRARCSYIVSTADRLGLRFVLRRWQGIRFGLVKSLAARSAVALGLFRYAPGDATVAGRVPGGPGQVESVPLAAARESGVGAGSVVLVTPWFEASRHVVAIALRGRRPVCVVKLPRRPGDDSGIRRESTALRRLAALSPGAAARAPAVLSPAGTGSAALVETPVAGKALGPERVRAHPARALREGMALVDALPVTGTTVADPGWFDRLLGTPLDRFQREAPAEIAAGPLVARTHERLAPLRSAGRLALVFEHGDLGHPNLIVRRDGRLAALDWERSEERGLPGHDAVFVLTYLAEARRGAFALDDRLQAFDAAFLGPAAWGREALAAHLARRGVDVALLAPLVLACWARSGCGLLDRLVGSAPGPAASPVVAADVVEDRDVALWRHVDRVYGVLR